MSRAFTFKEILHASELKVLVFEVLAEETSPKDATPFSLSSMTTLASTK